MLYSRQVSYIFCPFVLASERREAAYLIKIHEWGMCWIALAIMDIFGFSLLEGKDEWWWTGESVDKDEKISRLHHTHTCTLLNIQTQTELQLYSNATVIWASEGGKEAFILTYTAHSFVYSCMLGSWGQSTQGQLWCSTLGAQRIKGLAQGPNNSSLPIDPRPSDQKPTG